jgi:hypothetical protein
MVVRRRGPHPEHVPAQLLDLTARLARGDAAVARVAAAPVRHVPAAFLSALACTDAEESWTEPARARVLQLAR